MTTQDARRDIRDLIVDAQEHMNEAISCLARYVELTGDRHTEAYILNHLRIMTSSDHGFMSRDANLDDVLENLDEQDDDEDDEQLREDEAGYWSGIAGGLRR